MDKPTYREYKDNQENIDVRLIRASGERFYVEGTPYRFKYMQIGIFVLITAAALLISYMISGTADKTALDKYEYVDMIRKLLWHVSVYYAFVYFLFMIEHPLRYLFAGFRQVSEDFFRIRAMFMQRRNGRHIGIF
jgi:hypothetical protein